MGERLARGGAPVTVRWEPRSRTLRPVGARFAGGAPGRRPVDDLRPVAAPGGRPPRRGSGRGRRGALGPGASSVVGRVEVWVPVCWKCLGGNGFPRRRTRSAAHPNTAR
ncbi:hypothetical protein GCM10010428_37250 [Actinosynnema pretiosum subsp. pretiosum]